ncbi:uncharacterized protein ACIBXB_000777 [Morphnus guianensis]
MRSAELPGAAALFCFYPHVRHVVVQPGKTGGVGVPVLSAHARRAFDAEVGRWRAGPRGPPPCCLGPGGPGGLQDVSNLFISERLDSSGNTRYRAENKGTQTLSHLEEKEAKIYARGLTAAFTHDFRPL